MICRIICLFFCITNLLFAAFTYPNYSEHKLDNGLRVLLIKDDYQPLIFMNLMIHTGELADKKLGSVTLLSNLLDKGTKQFPGAEFNDFLSEKGSQFSVQSSSTYMLFTLSSLSEHFESSLTAVVDALVNANLNESDFVQQKHHLNVSLKESMTDKSWLIDYFSRKHLYEESSLWSKSITLETLDAIQLNDVIFYYQNYISPENATLVIKGDFSEEKLIKRLNMVFKPWNSAFSAQNYLEKNKIQTKDILFINKPGLTQATIALYGSSEMYDSKLYPSFRLMNYMLGGGGFSSVLTEQVRAKKGLTYSIYSSTSTDRLFSEHKIQTFTRNPEALKTIQTIQDVLNMVKNDGFSEERLVKAKSFYRDYLPGQMESPSFINQFILLGLHKGLTIEEIYSRYDQLLAVNLDDVMAVYTKHFKTSPVIVVLGDATFLLTDIQRLGSVSVVNFQDL